VTTAVKGENRETGRIIIEQFGLMMDFLRENMPRFVQLDSGEMVGALLPAVDMGLADRWEQVKRGVR